MRVLIVKTSSMGDVIHTLPALTDAVNNIPGIRFDWVAEEAFSEIPAWHSAVERVIPVVVRRWRKNWLTAWRNREITNAITALRTLEYDYVIDAQGLIKSAMICRIARGHRYGMSFSSCREALASLAYSTKYPIERNAHAIDRVRQLFANVLHYEYPQKVDYGLDKDDFAFTVDNPYVVFLHGASRASKRWPQSEWKALARLAVSEGFSIYLPSGNNDERERAEQIAEGFAGIHTLHSMSLTQVAGVLSRASGVVGVDTGISHMAAALDIPAVTLYLVTDPRLTGTCGDHQTCLSSGTFGGSRRQINKNTMSGLNIVETERLTVEKVWAVLSRKLNYSN